MKKASFHTLGCKLNYTETVTLSRRFRDRGYAIVGPHERPDVFVLNTCTVTERADRECRQIIRRVLRNSPETFVIVTGCYAQLNAREIASIGGVDLVLGSSEKFSAAELAGTLEKKPLPQIFVSCIDAEGDCAEAFSGEEGTRTRAFLKIQDGCDYACAFCTIPLARGASRSLPMENILAAAVRLGDEGYREVVLTGVNVGDYGRTSGVALLDLLRRLDTVGSVERFRISSIEPNLLSDELLRFILGSRRFVNHFHLPLQSGSREILRAMKRRYTRDHYGELVGKIRSMDPRAGIGADVIVGFPGETPSRFGETVSFLERLPLSYLHVFTYSERENTVAAGMRNPVEPRERYHRSERLRGLGRRIRAAFNAGFVGETVDVLLENASAGGVTTGLTTNYIRVAVRDAADLVNRIVPVTVDGSSDDVCTGSLALRPRAAVA
ncbi:MAG TPA: tRNA (N(6)-L-threonylcarbamoyladenosine(37)-C(2))-methylthiotransferase MtaB [Bacteroidota bacterium]|nr:tRNA (N(6)-L-threonylcarbamoyladenosine(37)-C(2))-methylthiotransferase MtaB [Bacteroidota bacterium]